MTRPKGSKNQKLAMSSAQRQKKYRARQTLKEMAQLNQLINLIKEKQC